MRILVVEDDPLISKAIESGLKSSAYAVDCIADGNQAQYAPKDISYDCILLDLGLPGIDGVQLLKMWRSENISTPVIIITARDGLDDRVLGLDIGADDYVVKPFSPKELMLRIQAVLKRCAPQETAKKKEVYQCGGLTVDFTARVVSVDGEPATMSPKEYDLLFYMVRNRGIALTREKLINEVWGYDYYGDARTLDTHIKLLRKSLGPYHSSIVTLRGVGYRFAMEQD